MARISAIGDSGMAMGDTGSSSAQKSEKPVRAHRLPKSSGALLALRGYNLVPIGNRALLRGCKPRIDVRLGRDLHWQNDLGRHLLAPQVLHHGLDRKVSLIMPTIVGASEHLAILDEGGRVRDHVHAHHFRLVAPPGALKSLDDADRHVVIG